MTITARDIVNFPSYMSFFFTGAYSNSNGYSTRNIAPNLSDIKDICSKTSKLLNNIVKTNLDAVTGIKDSSTTPAVHINRFNISLFDPELTLIKSRRRTASTYHDVTMGDYCNYELTFSCKHHMYARLGANPVDCTSPDALKLILANIFGFDFSIQNDFGRFDNKYEYTNVQTYYKNAVEKMKKGEVFIYGFFSPDEAIGLLTNRQKLIGSIDSLAASSLRPMMDLSHLSNVTLSPLMSPKGLSRSYFTSNVSANLTPLDIVKPTTMVPLRASRYLIETGHSDVLNSTYKISDIVINFNCQNIKDHFVLSPNIFTKISKSLLSLQETTQVPDNMMVFAPAAARNYNNRLSSEFFRAITEEKMYNRAAGGYITAKNLCDVSFALGGGKFVTFIITDIPNLFDHKIDLNVSMNLKFHNDFFKDSNSVSQGMTSLIETINEAFIKKEPVTNG